MIGSNEVSQDKALVYALDHVDIYACAWGPDGMLGNKVGYNKAPESLLNGTKYVSSNYQLELHWCKIIGSLKRDFCVLYVVFD